MSPFFMRKLDSGGVQELTGTLSLALDTIRN
jgi:hypothetical protein